MRPARSSSRRRRAGRTRRATPASTLRRASLSCSWTTTSRRRRAGSPPTSTARTAIPTPTRSAARSARASRAARRARADASRRRSRRSTWAPRIATPTWSGARTWRSAGVRSTGSGPSTRRCPSSARRRTGSCGCALRAAGSSTWRPLGSTIAERTATRGSACSCAAPTCAASGCDCTTSGGDRRRPSPACCVTNVVSHYREEPFALLCEAEDVEVIAWAHEGPAPPGVRLRTPTQGGAARLAGSGRYRAVICGMSGRVALPASYIAARRAHVPFVLWATIWAHPRTVAHGLSWLPTRYLYRHADAVATYGPHVSAYVAARRGRDDDVFVAAQAVSRRFAAPVPDAD